MKKFLFLFGFNILMTFCSLAQNNHEIKISVKGYDYPYLYLGAHFGNEIYVKDSARINNEGYFVFNKDGKLVDGMYLFLTKPNNEYVQFLFTNDIDNLIIKSNADSLLDNVTAEHSEQNSTFFDYLRFLAKKNQESEELMAGVDAEKLSKQRSDSIQLELKFINDDVVKYQNKIIKDHPNLLLGKLIAATKEPQYIENPNSKTNDKDKYKYLHDHWFDGFDFTDEAIFRSPEHFVKINQYVEQLTVQHPDSIFQSLKYVIDKMKSNETIFSFYIIHYLNKYVSSKFVGLDAVYVYLVKNYFSEYKPNWLDQENYDKMIDQANRWEPLLIGKKAPNLEMSLRDGTPINLYDVIADYKLVVFWMPDCSVCQKELSDLVDFKNEFAERDIKVFSVCYKLNINGQEKVGQCWEYLDKNKSLEGFINVVDPYLKSKFTTLYDVKNTPTVFLLDKDNAIISKKIAIHQVRDIVDELNKQKKLKKN